MTTTRSGFFAPDEIAAEVAIKLEALEEWGQGVDSLAFVPDGEPTLDLRLGETARRLRAFSLPLAIISNASLIANEGVRHDLALFDWVSLKGDGRDERVWRAVDRPHRLLVFEAILEGIEAFAAAYRGHLETETMLVAGLNDSDEDLEALGDFLASVRPAVCRLSSPTRPPACADVRCCDEERLAAATALLAGRDVPPNRWTRKRANPLCSILEVLPGSKNARLHRGVQEGNNGELLPLSENGAGLSPAFSNPSRGQGRPL
jgi:wyosine [tRNA(Phe)-imidazoG37] synthetase (radical SAM superfamily)